jgi:DNA-damage-inducible protein D
MKQNNLKMKRSLATKQKPIRQAKFNGETYYSIVDIIENLTGTIAPRTYWATLKKRDIQLINSVKQLNMTADDGKTYTADAANKQGIFRILMSVPSPNAEPFKTWLSGIGKQAIDKTDNLEQEFGRLPDIQKATIDSDEPMTEALQVCKCPPSLMQEWEQRGVEQGIEYALLHAAIAQWTFGLTHQEHKALKGLTQQNLYDHFTDLEFIFKSLGEEATKAIVIKEDAQGFIENFGAAQKGGRIAGEARKNVEKQLGKKVVSSANCLEK